MLRRIILLLASICATSCNGATPASAKPQPKIQFAFFHFNNERVRLTVDGKTVIDRLMTVSRDNLRYGLAAFVDVSLPACADIVVTTKRQRLAQRLCRTGQTKSVIIDGGPPLTVTMKDRYQGLD